MTQTKTKPHLLIIWDDIEPEVRGPFESEQQRDQAALEIRAADPNKRHGLYKITAAEIEEASTFAGLDQGYQADDEDYAQGTAAAIEANSYAGPEINNNYDHTLGHDTTIDKLTGREEVLSLHFAAFVSQYYSLPLPTHIFARMIEKDINPFPTITSYSTLNAKAKRLFGKIKSWFHFCAK
ncbi:MAG: hypothetical protein ACOC1Q_01920 [Desulfosalsimonas sp.]